MRSGGAYAPLIDMEHAPELTVTLDGAGGSATSPASAYYENAHPSKGHVRVAGSDVQIYFEVHGLRPGETLEQASGRPKVLMLMGLACTCSAWRWQLQDLVAQHRMTPDYIGSQQPQQPPLPQQQQQPAQPPLLPQQQPQPPQQPQPQQSAPRPRPSDPEAQRLWQAQHERLAPCAGQAELLVCIVDNRGVGLSSSPRPKQAYSTQLMARDALAVMDHLSWQSAHVVGFSMGGMVAQALAAAAPQRVQSLTLIATSCGGLQILPRSWAGIRTAFKMVLARTPEDAVDATLQMHFRRRTLRAWVPHLAATRVSLLRREYLCPAGPPQPPHGFQGQMSACWKHSLSAADAKTIRDAGFPILVVHGRQDKLASAANAEALARRLGAPCVILPGAHFIVREAAHQINILLSNFTQSCTGWLAAANAPALDPDPHLVRAWSSGGGAGKAGVGSAAVPISAAADGVGAGWDKRA